MTNEHTPDPGRARLRGQAGPGVLRQAGAARLGPTTDAARLLPAGTHRAGSGPGIVPRAPETGRTRRLGRRRGDGDGYVDLGLRFAYTLGAPLAYAWLPAELTAPGTAVEIGYFGRRYRAVVTAEPAFDPGMKKIRC